MLLFVAANMAVNEGEFIWGPIPAVTYLALRNLFFTAMFVGLISHLVRKGVLRIREEQEHQRILEEHEKLRAKMGQSNR